MQDIFVGRQPIFDRDLRVYAYELLFRAGHDNQAGFIDGDQATSKVISNAIVEFGLDDIVGDRLAFLNLTRGFLTGTLDIPLPRERLVLEILEDIEPDQTVIDSVKALREQGYSLALDDFLYRDTLKPLIPFCDIIKIDIMPMDEAQIREHVELLKDYPAKLLAEKVETQAEYEFCHALGFDYFQGYFLARPEVVKGKEITPNGLASVRLLAQLQDPEITPGQLEELISQDVGLSYKLLRYINSAFFALPKPIESIRQAVVYLGLQALKTWATLLVLTGTEDKPSELLKLALQRAKLCELLARAAGDGRADTYFTVGLFSSIEALIEIPLADILPNMPFSDDVKSALLEHCGPFGEALQCALALEQADWNQTRFHDLTPAQITAAYVEAAKWADASSQTLQSS